MSFKIYRTFLAASITLCASSVVNAQTNDEQPAEDYIAEYAEAAGINVEEVNQFQERSAEIMKLHGRFLREFPNDYLGARRIKNTNDLQVEFVGDFSPAERNSLPPYARTRGLIRKNEVLKRNLERTLSRLESSGVSFVSFIDLETQKLIIESPTEIRQIRGLINALGPDAVEFRQVNSIPVPTATIRGSDRVETATQVCTAGIPVVHSSGRKGITTAGHCGPGTTRINGAVVDVVENIYNPSRGVNSRDIRWHTDPGDTFLPEVKLGSTRYTLRQEGIAFVGAVVCFDGQSTGLRCAEVDATNVTATDESGLKSYNSTRIVRDGTSVVRKGDSGAAVAQVVSGTPWIFGAMHGGADPSSSGAFRKGYYVKVEDVRMMNLRPLLEP